MNSTTRFNFSEYYSRIEQAGSDAEVSAIRQEHKAYVAGLTEPEKVQFQCDLNAHLRQENDRAEIEIALLKTIIAKAQVVQR